MWPFTNPLAILKRNVINTCLLFMFLYAIYCARGKKRIWIEENGMSFSVLLCQQRTRTNSCLFNSLIYYIKILLVNCGKFLPSQLVLPELHLERCNVCLLPCVSSLCPNVEKLDWREGETQRPDYYACTCWNGRSLCVLPCPSILTSGSQLCRLCIHLPQLVSGPSSYMVSANRSNAWKEGGGESCRLGRIQARRGSIMRAPTWNSQCDTSANHLSDPTLENWFFNPHY